MLGLHPKIKDLNLNLIGFIELPILMSKSGTMLFRRLALSHKLVGFEYLPCLKYSTEAYSLSVFMELPMLMSLAGILLFL